MSQSIKNFNLDQFRLNRRSGQTASAAPTLTSNTPRGSVFGSLMPPMESTDSKPFSQTRDIEMGAVDQSSGEAEKEHGHQSGVLGRRAESVDSSALGREHSHFMRWVKVFNLITAAEVILFCAFSLIFHNVKLEGQWHEVSRLRLFDAVPITYLVQALFVIFEIVGVNALQSSSTTDLRVQRVRIHYWRGITTFCRLATPIVAALIIIGHRPEMSREEVVDFLRYRNRIGGKEW